MGTFAVFRSIFPGCFDILVDVPKLLVKIDKTQARFLRELGLSKEQAFMDFNFAPPNLRRNVGILGLLHKRVLGLCHPSFERLLPWYNSRFSEARGLGHSRQLYGDPFLRW